MVAKQDLVEAYSFNRRRLITAFVSGETGARAVEPARPGRTIVGGLALAGLLVAGAASARTVSQSVPANCAHSPGVIYGTTGQASVSRTPLDTAEAAQVTGPGR